MRHLVATLRFVCLLVLTSMLMLGCGRPQLEEANADNIPEGAILMEDGSYGFPPPSNEGYDRDSYGDGDDTDDYGGDDDDDDDDAAYASNGSDDEVEERTSYGGRDEGVEPPVNRNGYGDDNEGGNSSPGYDGYASNDGASNDGDGGYGGYGDGGAAQPAGGTGMYHEKIAPILRSRCYNCHGGGPRSMKGDLDLHTQEGIGYVVSAFMPDDSELLTRISLDQGDEQRMPPKGPGLSKDEVALIKQWIEAGARFDEGGNGYGDAYASGRPASNDDGYGDDDDDDDDEFGRRPAPPKNLAEAASVAFQRGNDLAAMNQLYAQTLVKSDPAAKQILEEYRFVRGLRRSKLAVRWGIGIRYMPKDGWKGSARPIGVHQDVPGGGDDDSRSGGDDPLVDFSNEQLDYYAGDFGDELLLRLQGRIERAYYGERLKRELERKLGGDENDEFDDGDGGGYGGYGGGSRGGGGGYGGGRGSGGGSNEKPESRVEQIMPGVMMVGVGSQAKLVEAAAAQRVDVLAVFDVEVEPNRRLKLVTNRTRLKLYNMLPVYAPAPAKDGRKVKAVPKLLVSSGKLNNIDVQKKRAEDDEYEPIIDEVSKVFAVADDQFQVEPFPTTITANSIKKRVLAILKENSENPLWKLAEIRFYENRELLTAKQVASVFKKIVPDNASTLMDVEDESEIRTMFSEWLIVDETSSDSSDGDDDDDDDDDDDRPRREFR